MATYKIRNNVYTTLSSSISNTDDTININSASSPFNNPPSISDGETGILTIIDSMKNSSKIEIINYTDIADNGDGTLTISGITRGKESTSAKSFSTGAFIIQSITKDVLDNIMNMSAYLSDKSIGDFSDVNASSLLNKGHLIYDSLSGKWESTKLYLNSLSDISISEGATISDNSILAYNDTISKGEVGDNQLKNNAFVSYYVSTRAPSADEGDNGDVGYVIGS